ncbi:MAG: xylulose kinase [Clostridia bacterium]|nr:xylulose kinase [Clostridia bacterium]
MTDPLLIGLDAGTSSVKAYAFDIAGQPRRQASVKVELSSPRPGWVDMPLDRYWEAVRQALRQVSQGLSGIAGIGLSVTSPTTVFFDRQAQPVRAGIPYLDSRSASYVDDLSAEVGGRDAYQAKVGNQPIPSTCALALAAWARREEPGSWERAVTIGFLNSFLAACLTGELAVDPTTASYSGAVNLAHPYRWSEELCQLMGLAPGKLLPILPPYAKIGEVSAEAAAETGLPAGTPVAVGCADTAAAAFALGLYQRGDAFESAGTSGVLTFCLDQPDFDAAFLNRAHVVPDRWLAHGGMSASGAAIEWLRSRVFKDLATADELEQEARRSVPGAHGVVFLPYLAGERSPIFDPAARGLWIGMRLDTNRADLIRAVYEGVAYGLRQLLERATEHWGFKVSALPCVGGAAMSPLGLQIRADVLGVPYRPATFKHAAAWGAALLGGIAGGIFSGPLDPKLPCLADFGPVVKPDPANRSIYDQLFSVYNRLYPCVKAAMHALP